MTNTRPRPTVRVEENTRRRFPSSLPARAPTQEREGWLRMVLGIKNSRRNIVLLVRCTGPLCCGASECLTGEYTTEREQETRSGLA